MLRSTCYTTSSGSIAALEYGDAQSSSCSLVLLHGWLDNAASFQTTIEALITLNPSMHICAIDLPGHGFSSHKSADNFYLFFDYLDDLYQLLVNISPNKLLLVGHSLGALLASCYSAAFPEQVAGLVQIEGNGPLAEEPHNCVTRLRTGIKSRQRIRNKPLRTFSTLDDAIALRVRVNHLLAEQIKPVVSRGMCERENGWAWRHDVKLQSDSLYRMASVHAAQFRQQIVCPQLIILGTMGYEHLQQDNDNFTDVVYIEGGHHCHLQQPQAVAERIFGLVNKI